MHLLAPERFIAAVIAFLAAADLCLVGLKSQAVDWRAYAPLVAIGLCAMLIGQVYRRSGRSAEIALAATAAGLYILFTLAASVFNYLLLPVGALTLDPVLARIDSHFGYSWAAFVQTAAEYPRAAAFLRHVYLSSLVQLLSVLILLGFMGRREALHEFMLVGTLGAVGAIGIWAISPSMGPSVLHTIPAATQQTLGLVVGSDYGAELRALASHGPRLITPSDTLGLIAFPSFHTVMACMAVFFTWPIKSVRLVFLVINLAMLPAILLHGGHHLMDVFAGFAVFAAALGLSRYLLTSVLRRPLASN